jgi:hypothetical protein
LPWWPRRPGPVLVETCLTELALKFVAQVGSSMKTSWPQRLFYNTITVTKKVVKGL